MSQAAKRTSRGIVIVLAGTLHILILESFIRGSHRLQTPAEDETTVATLLFFNPITERGRPNFQAIAGKPLAHRSGSRGRDEDRGLPIIPPPAATAPVAVDWAKEAERAATQVLQADAKARRQLSAVSPDRRMNADTGKAGNPAPQFRWDYAHTHRLEALPGGGMILNVNDRCAIVVKVPFIFGGCRIGAIESRGDLFEHMRDPLPAAHASGP